MQKNLKIVIAIVVCLCVLTAVGFGIKFLVIDKLINTNNDSGNSQATESVGGVTAVFKPADDFDVTAVQLDAAKSIIETRLGAYGITEYEIGSDYEKDHITLRFPLPEDDADFDPEEAVNELTVTARLTFRSPDGEIIMDGSAVEKATAAIDSFAEDPDRYLIQLDFNSEGTRLFADATERYMGQTIGVYLDETLVSNPTVYGVISDGHAQISGNLDAESATQLADQINGGALPFTLEVDSVKVD